VEAEELQEAPAPRAPARRGLARVGSEVPHQQPQAVFHRGHGRRRPRRSSRGPPPPPEFQGCNLRCFKVHG